MDQQRLKDIKKDILAKELDELRNIEKQHKKMNGKLYEEVAKLKKETGYPHVLSVQSTKNARERAYKVQKALFF